MQTAALPQKATFFGAKLSVRNVASQRMTARRFVVSNDSCLIINTKGGGHSFLGLYLAKKLIADGHKVTIINDGEKVRGFSYLFNSSIHRSNPSTPPSLPNKNPSTW